jgi:hypothetical protein
VWWCTLIPAMGRLREDCEFKAVDYIEKTYLKKKD